MATLQETLNWVLWWFKQDPTLERIDRVSPKPRQRVDREVRVYKNWRGEITRRECRDVHYALHHTKGWRRTFTSPWTECN